MRIGELKDGLMCVRGICGRYGVDELLMAEYVRDWTPLDGKVGHTSKTCRKKDNKKCFCCGMTGHIKQHCPKRSKDAFYVHGRTYGGNLQTKGSESMASQLPEQLFLPVIHFLQPYDEELKNYLCNTVEDVVTTTVQTVGRPFGIFR